MTDYFSLKYISIGIHMIKEIIKKNSKRPLLEQKKKQTFTEINGSKNV